MDETYNVLVTGGTGLVGSAIQKIIKNEKFNKFSFKFIGTKDADLTKIDELKKIFDQFKPTHIIHLGAKVGGLFNNLENNLEFFRTNNQINDNVLNLAYEYKVKKCISCLSTCIFPNETKYPITENMVHNGPPHDSNFGYSYAKRMIDVLNKAYDNKLNEIYKNNKKEKPVFTSVIPTNVYGPNDNYNLKDSHVIAGLTHKAYLIAKEAIVKGKKNATLKVCGSGKPLRQFIYSEDLANLILWVLQEYNNVEPIILSVDEKDEISIGHVAELIANEISENFNIKLDLQYDLNFSDGQFKKTADNAKLKRLYGDYQFTNIQDGIKESVKWFSENYENCRK